MHDELLERRLRAALHEEADHLGFTITAAELERRAELRNRGRSGGRLALLLAAAVGIGLLGIGGALGGLFTQEPGPSDLAVATPSSTARSEPSDSPGSLPTLAELVDLAGSDSVVVAQAHDPVDAGTVSPAATALGGWWVSLGEMRGSTEYEVIAACRGGAAADIFSRAPASDRLVRVTGVVCDGNVQRTPVRVDGPSEVVIAPTASASWRVVVRRLDGGPEAPLEEPPVLEVAGGEELLFRVDDQTLAYDPAATPIGRGLVLERIGDVPTRRYYVIRLWCAGSDAIEYLQGDDVGGVYVPRTVTRVACDGRTHEIVLLIPESSGYRIAVAAEPATRWSVLVSGEVPPIALVVEEPGWTLSAGAGPNLELNGTTTSFTGPGVEGGGQVRIAMSCTGTEPIEVTVDTGAVAGEQQASFVASCTPDGATTVQGFDTAASYVDVTYTPAPGSWTAVSILVPEPASALP